MKGKGYFYHGKPKGKLQWQFRMGLWHCAKCGGRSSNVNGHWCFWCGAVQEIETVEVWYRYGNGDWTNWDDRYGNCPDCVNGYDCEGCK